MGVLFECEGKLNASEGSTSRSAGKSFNSLCAHEESPLSKVTGRSSALNISFLWRNETVGVLSFVLSKDQTLAQRKA